MTVTGREWEDWGTAPATATIYQINRYFVDIAASALATYSNADRTTGVFGFEYGVPAPEYVTLEFYSGRTGTPPLDVIAITSFTVRGTTPVYVPVSFIAPNIFLRNLGASVDGYDIITSYVTLAEQPNNVAMLVSPLAIASTDTIPATSEVELFPASCLPGRLTLYFTTTATDYDVILRTWIGATAVDMVIGSDAAPVPVGLELTTPIGSFALVVVNNDVTSSDYTLTAIYQP